MRIFLTVAIVLCAAAMAASPALADDPVRDRDIQAAVDAYLADAGDEASLVGGPGSAGYDAGFWIRGGDFLLRINATLQARFESWDWDDEDDAGRFYTPFAGDTSGFSLPRATLKFSGEAPCDICWYMELEFGHFGRDALDSFRGPNTNPGQQFPFGLGPASFQADNFDNTREAWIEWCYCPAFNFRMGQVKLATTRQMMVAPELQQFVDISFASSWTGILMPGYTDRNRDHGFLVHGAFGCNNEWSYLISVTNGDGGDSIRNVLDHRTSDNLAYGARLNWAFLAPIGYEEGALRQQTCQWYGELGAWAFYYADRYDKPHTTIGDVLVGGLDVALGYGGFSFTAAYTIYQNTDAFLAGGGSDITGTAWLAQLGYHFPGTAWEIAARASRGFLDLDFQEGDITELAFGVNYYLNGHGNKLQLDVTFLEATDTGIGHLDPYPGFQWGFLDENSATMLRFQWQLAL